MYTKAQLSRGLKDIEEKIILNRHIDFLGINKMPSDAKQGILKSLEDKDFIKDVMEKSKKRKEENDYAD